MLRSLDLFTGYGGITLALENYCQPIAYVEIEEYAQRIIAERMADGSLPRAPILADVKNVRGKSGDCDIIVGGFPCQDISVARNGKGLAGERSGLFFEIARLTKEIQPSFVFLENSPAIRTRGLYHVANEFTAMGYACRWTVVSAGYVGAAHERKRFFLLAHANSKTIRKQPIKKQRELCKAKPFNNGLTQQVADSASERLEGAGRQKQRMPIASKLSRKEWLKIEPAVCRGTHGTSYRVDRLKALGNGVVPEQARVAFEYLMGIKDGKL
jgi:DNA (cytosine-5)-methyltransferase 1